MQPRISTTLLQKHGQLRSNRGYNLALPNVITEPLLALCSNRGYNLVLSQRNYEAMASVGNGTSYCHNGTTRPWPMLRSNRGYNFVLPQVTTKPWPVLHLLAHVRIMAGSETSDHRNQISTKEEEKKKTKRLSVQQEDRLFACAVV